jgi:hypothetical protein
MRVFTAGVLEGNRARAGMVIHRVILTLTAPNAPP